MYTPAKILLSALLVCGATHVAAEDGVTDTEVKIGHTAPYSGPAAAYGTIGRAFTAYFDKVNKEGGIHGRKIVVLSRDDAYSPPKVVEVTRQLVEKDRVFAMASIFGAANNMAVRSYLNENKVPHLFMAAGSSEVASDPVKYPYTVGWALSNRTEGMFIAQHILKNARDPKIAVLFQNDDLGKDVLKGLKAGLGDKVNIIVGEQSYESTAATVNSEIISLKASGATVFVNLANPRIAALAIRKIAELQWKPAQYLEASSNSVSAVLKPGGFANSQGMISFQFFKDPTDPRWAKDEGFLAWLDFMDKYLPNVSKTDVMAVIGYSQAETLRVTLEKAGRNLTRSTLMQAATNLKDVQASMLIPGVKLNTTPMNRYPVSCSQVVTFRGETWNFDGELICSH